MRMNVLLVLRVTIMRVRIMHAMNASMAVNGALKTSAILVQLATFSTTPPKVVSYAQITVLLALM